MIPVDEEPGLPVGVDRQFGREVFALALGMLVGPDTKLVEVPEEFGFSLPAGVGGNESEAVAACRDRRQLLPEPARRFRGIAPQLIPGGQAVVRARRARIF